MKKGHTWLLNNLGVIPTVGFQADPFGHSLTNTRLFSEIGFDTIFQGRISVEEKKQRIQDGTLEFISKPF